MNKKYVLKLTAEERSQFEVMTQRGVGGAAKLRHARGLLLVDQSDEGAGWTDAQTAEAVGVSTRCVEKWRKRACEEGPVESLEPRRGKRVYKTLLDGEAEAELVKLACSKTPEGRDRWSLRLLASRMVELQIVETVSHETVRQTLQKTP